MKKAELKEVFDACIEENCGVWLSYAILGYSDYEIVIVHPTDVLTKLNEIIDIIDDDCIIDDNTVISNCGKLEATDFFFQLMSIV